MKGFAATQQTATKPRPVRRRVLVLAGAAALWFGVAAALPAAAPVYTDWSAPVWLGPVVNSASTEQGPALSRDGLSLYFYSGRAGGVGSDDIWVSHRATLSSPWGAPVDLGPTINSPTRDFVPAFSTDGHWMFFASDRPGGFGPSTGTPTADIYESYRADVHDDFGWQAPVNLGAGVNTPYNDNGVGYFDNGGSPQLYFGSDRPGGLGNTDFYRSNLQANGTWGPASAVPELSSPDADNRPTLRDDGLEIFFYSGRPGGMGVDIWTATRPTVTSTWSTPVDVGPTVNSSATELHPYLSGDGRALVFASARAGGSGSTDLYMTTRAGVLTVTADGRSRLFGEPNPPLTYTITGFVGSDTAAVVSGAASCTTTATQSSPAGAYPITCSVGTLSAPGYTFGTFVAGTLTVTYTSPCLTGLRVGPLTVAAGQAICIGAGGSQTGPVTVKPGGSLDVEGGRITGPVGSTGAGSVRLCGATVTGPVTVSGSTGPVVVGDPAAPATCAGNTIVGPVRVKSNVGGTTVAGNTIVGSLTVDGNAAPVVDAPNTVTGPSMLQ